MSESMNCNDCKDRSEGKFEHEAALALAERTIKRLWVLAILLIVCLIGTNVAWIVYESQWEVVEETTSWEVQQDADRTGRNLVVGGNYYEPSDGQVNDNDTAQNSEDWR